MDYEDRLIIYLDVLGFGSFVNYTSESRVNVSEKIDKIDSCLSMINKFFRTNPKSLQLSNTKKVTSFSDLIVVSVNTSEIEFLDHEIMEVFYLLINSIYKGFLLRGSIVYGKLIHTDEVIFGSGLIEAYERERTISKYPRVIIDSAIANDLIELAKNNGTSTLKDIIVCDNDGIYYINIFSGLRSYTDNYWQYTKILDAICEIIINMFDNPILKEKREWLIEKFVEHIEENSESLKYSFESNPINTFELRTFQSYLSEFDSDKYKKML
jgi:hypothetical protein